MSRHFGRPRVFVEKPRDPKKIKEIENALSVECQERAFRVAEKFQHIVNPWERDELGLLNAIWTKKDSDWRKLVYVQVALVIALGLLLILALR
jgi:hypothetical protein